MEDFVENGLELTNHLVDRHFDKSYDKVHDRIRKKKTVPPQTTPHDNNNNLEHQQSPTRRSSSPSSSHERIAHRSAPAVQEGRPAARGRTLAGFPQGGAALPGLPIAAAVGTGTVLGENTHTPSTPGSRRRQRNQLPSPHRDIGVDRDDSVNSLREESQVSDRVLRQYEAEPDDPKRHPASVLSNRDLGRVKDSTNQKTPRRDSAMASGYQDNYYGNTQYQGEGRSRSAQPPPKSRGYDDDDSDYDERSGRRYGSGRGRGYDDRDDDRGYDRVVEETERYRGPPVDRPWGADRRESYRSGHDGPYGAGAVTQYGRRSDGALDRAGGDSYVSRRSKSGGRDRDDRDRSYSRSRSRSRSRDGEGGIKDKIEGAFDTSARGLGVGLAGAVIGGLAGREFGHKHRQRDIIIGALVGGLGANAAENKYKDWRESKKEQEERYEQKYDGRSRSNVR